MTTNATPVEAQPVATLARQEPQAPEQVALTPLEMISSVVQRGADPNALDKVTAWAERMQANEARRAYAQAITNFKAMCPTIVRHAKGHTNTYATLVDIDEQIRPLLIQCQLSPSWRVVKNDKDWIEVECRITHVMGHSESTPFGGPPDRGPGRNELQARASTVSYLERYTLKALLGLVDKDMPDNDGGDGAPSKEPPKPKSPADPEAETKKEFWIAAHKKTGARFTMQQIQAIFAKVQEACGSEAAADCLTYIQRNNVALGADGGLIVATAPPEGDPLGPGEVTEADFTNPAAPAGPHTGSSSGQPATEPPSFPPFVCLTCGLPHQVKPAKCLGREGAKCAGKVVPNCATWECKSGHKFPYADIKPCGASAKGICPVCDKQGKIMAGIEPVKG